MSYLDAIVIAMLIVIVRAPRCLLHCVLKQMSVFGSKSDSHLPNPSILRTNFVEWMCCKQMFKLRLCMCADFRLRFRCMDAKERGKMMGRVLLKRATFHSV